MEEKRYSDACVDSSVCMSTADSSCADDEDEDEDDDEVSGAPVCMAAADDDDSMLRCSFVLSRCRCSRNEECRASST